MMNKRGGVGSGIAMFFAIILILIMLGVFIGVSGIWKAFSEEPAGNIVSAEGELNESMFGYMGSSENSIQEVKFIVASGKSIEEAVVEVGYNEK